MGRRRRGEPHRHPGDRFRDRREDPRAPVRTARLVHVQRDPDPGGRLLGPPRRDPEHDDGGHPRHPRPCRPPVRHRVPHRGPDALGAAGPDHDPLAGERGPAGPGRDRPLGRDRRGPRGGRGDRRGHPRGPEGAARVMRLRALAFVVFFALSLAAFAGAAQAHAEYVSSDPHQGAILPQAPGRVSLTLSEAVQAGTASTRLPDANGTRVDVPPTTISVGDSRTFYVALGPIRPGVYIVTWTATSAVDGHFTAGSFAFGVQDSSGNLPGSLPCQTSTARPV